MTDHSASSSEATTYLLLKETQMITVDAAIGYASRQRNRVKETSFSEPFSKEGEEFGDVEHKIDDTDGKERFDFEEKEQESEAQRLLEAEKKIFLAKIEVGSIFEKNGNGSKDVLGDNTALVKRSLKIELIDDTAFVGVVPLYKKSNDHPKRPRKHKKIGEKPIDGGKHKGDASTRLSEYHNHDENNGKQFRILYSRKQMESMRFAHIVNQKKLWSEMYARLLPEVVTDYESLVSHWDWGLLKKSASVRAEKPLEVGDKEVIIMANRLITITGR
ncbi:uncharacterized protein LOC112085114 [Eutrema salsugineum]|uniref:uncharacterized protein LOC112085114 n=1 Tax=Eutrema salsugineum TaxID=72664 RepID=UPI000CECEA95|nr:uncharacterized protein LOC112085114 [Eutrema salsugineum]